MFPPCNRRASGGPQTPFPPAGRPLPPALAWSLAIFFWLSAACGSAPAAEPVAAAVVSSPLPTYNIRTYVLQGRPLLGSNFLASLFAKYTGTNVSLIDILHAASDLETQYRLEGYRRMNIVIAPRRIANGIATLDAFPGAVPQIVVAGRRFLVSSNGVELVEQLPGGPPNAPGAPEINTNRFPPFLQLSRPATEEEMTRAYAALAGQMADLTARERETHIHVAATNAGPRFTVNNYQIVGNTILSPATISTLLTNIDGAFGTNVSLDGIRAAASQLQMAYRARGFVTVAVTLPPQKLTNATVNIQVTEGRLTAIVVKGNHFYSYNNVMRALPSLRTNLILNGQIFQAELNRANADQDRQIYPVVEAGPDPGTTLLTLNVKDRLPVHAKVDLDNQSSPGTPDQRVNASAVVDNLWQHDNSLGVQYGFSPDEYKQGSKWHFYDRPLVANYSAYYRLPLANPSSIEQAVTDGEGNFGYDEATRKFNLPPASGLPEINVYASRSAIDTGVETLSTKPLYTSQNRTITEINVQQDLTINNDAGARLTVPLPPASNFHSDVSGGLDFKTYETTNGKTNVFEFTEITFQPNGQPNPPVVSYVYSPVPLTENSLEYLPLTLRYGGGWRDALGTASFGLSASGNPWYSALTTLTGTENYTNSSGVVTNRVKVTSIRGLKSFQQIAGSKESSGHWIVLNPSFSHTFEFVTNWVTTIRADGQWSSEPLISSEQFGAGGVNSVRGYQEGQVFGDTGWHVSVEQQTPPHVVGTVYGHTPLTIRGTAYMDFATTYLLDPQGRPAATSLWGVGCGIVAAIGSHWDARFLCSLPLLDTPTTAAFRPFFNFALTGRF